MYTKKAAAAILILATIVSCGKKEKEKQAQYKPKQSPALIITAGTMMRIDPVVFSSRVAQLNKGDTVIILDRSSEKSWIGKQNDYWYKVKTSKGLQGWVFGKNMEIISDANKGKLDSIVAKFWEKESEAIKKDLSGKWWSVNRFGDFTSHGLEIYKNGEYKSFLKSPDQKPLEGKYNLDFVNNEIVFLNGTTFGSNLNFSKMGQTYVLEKTVKENEIKFKKIVNDIEARKLEEKLEEEKAGKKGEPKDKKQQ